MTGPAGGLLDPLEIGALRLDRRLFMAPLAGLTIPAFRRSVRRFGAGLVFTEMIAVAGLWYGNRRTLDYLVCGADEHPIGFQLLGADPAMIGRAVDFCLQAGADLIDLNMACPVRKVVKTGAGAALLGEQELAARLVRAACAAAAGVPVTVKLRAGLRPGDGAALDLAPRLAAAGAAAVCIHPRSVSQLYRGVADHSVTEALAHMLSIPVVASGDIGHAEDGKRLLDAGAAAVMVARAALGRPWVFAEFLGADQPTDEQRRDEMRQLAQETISERGERAVGYLRQLWPRFRAAGVLDRATCVALMAAPTTAELVGRLWAVK